MVRKGMIFLSKVIAMVLAAGKGSRMEAGINKQFLELNNKPILYYTLKAFESNDNIDEIVLVASENEIKQCKVEIVDRYKMNKVKKIVVGGKERQNSVLNGLKEMDECEIVLIHDGARPFITDDIINTGIEKCKKYGASACGVIPVDTIKVRDNDSFSKDTLKRNDLFAIQTPQIFKYDLIKSCHERALEDQLLATDDTMVVERYGHKVYLFDGTYTNIKITNKQDMFIAEQILKNIFTNLINNV